MAVSPTSPERKLRITIGASRFGQRLLRISTRELGGIERTLLQTKEANTEILLPLRPRELIVTDLPINGETLHVKGIPFTIGRKSDGQWTIDETLINEFREYVPDPISSRVITFTLATAQSKG